MLNGLVASLPQIRDFVIRFTVQIDDALALFFGQVSTGWLSLQRVP
jgi:hypothetical protein